MSFEIKGHHKEFFENPINSLFFVLFAINFASLG
jgi:hypothetical protein